LQTSASFKHQTCRLARLFASNKLASIPHYETFDRDGNLLKKCLKFDTPELFSLQRKMLKTYRTYPNNKKITIFATLKKTLL